MRASLIALMLMLASPGARAAAGDPPRPAPAAAAAPTAPNRAPAAVPAPAPPPPAPAAKGPVRVGPTTVTVIDEQESVDDIISRVRRAREERRAKRTAPGAPASDQAAPREDRKSAAKLRDKLDGHPARERVRERLQRLREPLRERVTRDNRVRAARGD